MNAVSTKTHLEAFYRLLARDERAGKLNMRDLQVLALVVSRDLPLGVGAVASTLEISVASVSRVASKLVERGFLLRFDNPDNRRIALLEPTPAGRALDKQVRDYHKPPHA